MELSVQPGTSANTKKTSSTCKHEKPHLSGRHTKKSIQTKNLLRSKIAARRSSIRRAIQNRAIRKKQLYSSACIKLTVEKFCNVARVIIKDYKKDNDLALLTAETMTRQFCLICRMESRNKLKSINKIMDVMNIIDNYFSYNTEKLHEWIHQARFNRLNNINDIRAVFRKKTEQHPTRADKQLDTATDSAKPSTSQSVSRQKTPNRRCIKHVQYHTHTERDNVRDTLIQQAISALQSKEKSAKDIAATLQKDHSARWVSPHSLHVSLKRWILDNKRAPSFGFSQTEIDNAQSKYQ